MHRADRLSRGAWAIVGLLWVVATLNYLDRQMLATMKSSMVGDIPSIANKADWGLVLGCFKWTYAVLSPFGGFIADRLSRRHVICTSLFVWSGVTWWTGHVSSFHELMAARALRYPLTITAKEEVTLRMDIGVSQLAWDSSAMMPKVRCG